MRRSRGMKYTHKMIFKSDTTTTTIQVYRPDTPQTLLNRFKDMFYTCHTVSIQKYPLKNNKIEYFKKLAE